MNTQLLKMAELADKLLDQVLPQAGKIVLNVSVVNQLALLVAEVKRGTKASHEQLTEQMPPYAETGHDQYGLLWWAVGGMGSAIGGDSSVAIVCAENPRKREYVDRKVWDTMRQRYVKNNLPVMGVEEL